MATIHQERLYNEIIEYYAFADRLIKVAEDSSHQLSEKQFAIIEEVVEKLEDVADKLATLFIEYVKQGTSDQVSESIRSALNEASATITQCKNKILMLHHNNN